MALPEINITISAATVAWYAAIISTASVIIAILNYLGDKRRLRVSASHGFLTGVGDDATKVILTAANVGKRPVTVQGVGFLFNDGSLILMNTPNLRLPKTVEQGESCSTWINHDELLESLKGGNRTKKDIKSIWFRDSTGVRFTAKSKLKW